MAGSRSLLSVVLMMMSLMTSHSTSPDFSNDYYTEDHVTYSSFVQEVHDLRYRNEDKPDHCRNDLCEQEFTSTERRGEFFWPQSSIGYRTYVRCPYSVETPVYAYRDCKLDIRNYTVISEWNNATTEHCPEPPVTEILKQLHNYLEEIPEPDESWYLTGISKVLEAAKNYPDFPLYEKNVVDYLDLLDQAFTQAWYRNHGLGLETLLAAFDGLDWILTTDTQTFSGYSLSSQNKTRSVWLLTLLTEMMSLSVNNQYLAKQGHTVMMVLQQTTDNNIDNVQFTVHTSPEAEIKPHTTSVSGLLGGQGMKLVRFLYLDKPPSALTYNAELNSTSIQDDQAGYMGYEYSMLYPSGPMLYVSVDLDPEHPWSQGDWITRVSRKQDVSILMTFDPYLSVDYDAKCGVTPGSSDNVEEGFELEAWYSQPCTLISSENVTACQCNATGYLSLFEHMLQFNLGADYGSGYYGDYYDYYEMDRDSSMAVFLGFPYRYELYVTSHVFRALSVLCLVLTIISHLFFSKRRRGTPTKILLNLCAALLALLVVLYICEAISFNRVGCRTSNILRYYFIMVSLMWNGVEAANMYLMLVKVFNHEIHKFVLKASFVSWGVPMVLIAIVLAVSKKNFDGIWTDACEFRCQLRKPVLYYAYLLPLGLILVANSVVFGLVMRSLLKNKPTVRATKEREVSPWMRLCGAVSMMILLGVPWIFSAFGAIDAVETNIPLRYMEAVFHVVFVVFVNLQGVFIFLFHCARNAEIREQWRSTLSRTQTTSTTDSRDSIDMAKKNRTLSTANSDGVKSGDKLLNSTQL